MLCNLKNELDELADPQKANEQTRYFKTNKGEYAENTVFLGIAGPDIKKIANKYSYLEIVDVLKLLRSNIHTERSIALLIFVNKFKKGSDEIKENIYNLYIENTEYINNWDLVDISCYKIVGEYLGDRDKGILYKLARSENIWERRIAIVSTFQFIKNGKIVDTFQIAEILLNDKHDLIHKAVGWMLREAGKRCSLDELEAFLKKHYKLMPRTMLRYAIEKFPEKKRQKYLKGYI